MIVIAFQNIEQLKLVLILNANAFVYHSGSHLLLFLRIFYTNVYLILESAVDCIRQKVNTYLHKTVFVTNYETGDILNIQW